MIGRNIVKVLLTLSIAVFLFGSGYRVGQLEIKQKIVKSSQTNPQTNGKNIDFSLFWEAWDKLEQKYIDKDKLDPKKMFYGAIKGMVSATEDPYTFFLTPEENRQSKDDLGGKFEGIGAQLGLKENRIIIVAPLKNSPAESAGVKAGDFINKVDDQETREWTLPQAVSKIRGPKGTKVKLILERDAKELELSIMRDEIKVESVELSYEKNNKGQIAHLKLNQFGENTNEEWDRAVDEIAGKWRRKEIKGMILDLRDNPGGYLDGAVYLAADFLPEGKVIVKQESTTSNSRTYYVERTGKLLDVPLVVLINKGSASASEILAGSLRDYKRSKLVGEKTFGKGSIQEALDLKDDAGIHITVAKWILPNGDWINGKGIEPDTNVENKVEDGTTLTRENDKQLEKAIEEVLK